MCLILANTMKTVQVSVLFVLSCVSTSYGNGVKDATFSRIAFETLLTKLDYLQNNLEYLQEKMDNIESAMKETDQKLLSAINQQSTLLQTQCNKDRESFGQKLPSDINQLAQTIDQKVEKMDSKVNQQNDNVATELSQGKKDREILNEKLASVTGAVNQLRQIMNHNFASMRNQLNSTTNKPQTSLSLTETCKNEPSKRSGKYLIKPTGYETPFEVYCEQGVFEGGWIVFQYRFDGSVDFYQNWTEYRNGFGSLDGEFWLGLEHLHRLTSARRHELLVELKDAYGSNMEYARYDHFEIASESEQYALKNLGRYTGTAEDSLALHKGMKFSTKDRDNDRWSDKNCAATWKGAWWYRSCYHSNLNGLHKNGNSRSTLMWNTDHHVYTRMLIREF